MTFSDRAYPSPHMAIKINLVQLQQLLDPKALQLNPVSMIFRGGLPVAEADETCMQQDAAAAAASDPLEPEEAVHALCFVLERTTTTLNHKP